MTEEQHAEAILRAAGAPGLDAGAKVLGNARRQAILTALRAYGYERAADMRERAADKLQQWVEDMRKETGANDLSIANFLAAKEAIRALPLQEPKQ